MNYLAHALLAGEDPELVVGGLVADLIRGPASRQFSPGVRAGIRLHREIDAFTDRHPRFLESVARVRGPHRLYAPALVDIFYDHILARNFRRFGRRPLADFAVFVSDAVERSRDALPALLPERARDLSWLVGYARVSGIRLSLRRLSARSRQHLDFTPISAASIRRCGATSWRSSPRPRPSPPGRAPNSLSTPAEVSVPASGSWACRYSTSTQAPLAKSSP